MTTDEQNRSNPPPGQPTPPGNWDHFDLYVTIAAHPYYSVVIFLLVLIGIAILPPVIRQPWWPQSPAWAQLVFQFGALVVLVVGGVVPIARWYTDRMMQIKDQKPVVVTDGTGDTFTISNMGRAPAVNVWLLVTSTADLVPLGSLLEGETKPLSDHATAIIREQPVCAHVLVAEARPTNVRMFTVTFNTRREPETAFRHDFSPKVPDNDSRLFHQGPVQAFLHDEGAGLIKDLVTFVATKNPTSSAAHDDSDDEPTGYLIPRKKQERP